MQDFERTEADLKALSSRLADMETRAGDQFAVSSDPSTHLPVLESPIDAPLRDLRKSLLSVESSQQSSTLTDRVALKVQARQTTEVSGKETIVELVQTALGSYRKTHEELLQTDKEMRAGLMDNAKECHGAVNELLNRFHSHQESLQNEITEGLMRSQGSGKALITKELDAMIDTEVHSLRNDLNFKAKQLDYLLKQELLSLKIQLDGVKISLFPRKVAENVEIKSIYQSGVQAVKLLESIPSTTTVELNQLLTLLETDIREITAEIRMKQPGFSAKLDSTLFQLEMVRSGIVKLEERCEEEMERMKTGGETLYAAYEQEGEDVDQVQTLKNRIEHLQGTIRPQLSELKKRFLATSRSLKDVWTEAVQTDLPCPPVPAASQWPEDFPSPALPPTPIPDPPITSQEPPPMSQEPLPASEALY